MSQKIVKLFEEDGHICLFLTGLVEGEGIPSNQLVIVNHGEAALFDPGGELTYTPLSIELSKHISLKALRYVFASHQDPDIITSLPRWLMHTDCKVVTSRLWARFLPHLVSSFVSGNMNKGLVNRLVELPDEGAQVKLGQSHIKAIPAHFLHSVGNFHFYDPVSKILFSGDVGAAMTPGEDHEPVTNMQEHIPLMAGFHKRYMASNVACRKWVNTVRKLDIEKIVPQHGKPIFGKPHIAQFLAWFEDLECGIDLM
ncbi:MAG: MBL fold metallo-hydrolase [Pseudomonadales bacterium]|uniref:Flavoprotein n=1 Tax=Oleiphilus messinensis TaxID=141451 RepID=A0A1Y0I7D4_9GAMM|nr:MBL fold metallo-hydrolase [Oleiphilus messinensis]ARU56109.1 flavoprotein [Oleiphilus messinensis]MCG8610613.1 MBL fold metallo-hydrolase [Pseudomonadales bacterium]